MMHPDLPSQLAARRTRIGASQRRVANIVGCHPQTIDAWERGRQSPQTRVRAEQWIDAIVELEVEMLCYLLDMHTDQVPNQGDSQ